MLARNSVFDCVLPSISTETNVSARSRSRPLVSLVSRARFQELSKARTYEPSSERPLCCATDRVSRRAAPAEKIPTICKDRIKKDRVKVGQLVIIHFVGTKISSS